LTDVTLVPFGSQHMRVSWFPYLGTPAPTIGKFTEDFDSSWSQRWTVFGGNWLARGGSLSTMPASANGAKALAMATEFTNLVCEANVSVGEKGDAGLVFRVSKPDIGADAYCGYYAGINVLDSRVQIGCVNNGWHALASAPMIFRTGKSYHLRIQAQGSHLQVFVGENANPILDVHDDHFSNGMVGVRDFCPDGDLSISSFSKFSVQELTDGSN